MPPPPPPSDAAGTRPATVVVVPIRSFDGAKTRLAEHLAPAERADLARRLAAGVVAAAGDLPVVVVTGDAAVAHWARARRATVVDDPGGGLDAAADAGRAAARAAGARRLVVAHADLPAVVDLLAVTDRTDAVVLVPDRRRDGTNVLALDVALDFRFRYGPGSFERHRREAERCGVTAAVVLDDALAWDVDEPEDLAGLVLDDLP